MWMNFNRLRSRVRIVHADSIEMENTKPTLAFCCRGHQSDQFRVLLVPVNQFVGGFSSVIMWRIQDADCYALDRLLIVCDSNRNGSLQSLIFMMILMFCTLEVVLFKTLIALNLTEEQNRVTY